MVLLDPGQGQSCTVCYFELSQIRQNYKKSNKYIQWQYNISDISMICAVMWWRWVVVVGWLCGGMLAVIILAQCSLSSSPLLILQGQAFCFKISIPQHLLLGWESILFSLYCVMLSRLENRHIRVWIWIWNMPRSSEPGHGRFNECHLWQQWQWATTLMYMFTLSTKNIECINLLFTIIVSVESIYNEFTTFNNISAC